MDGPSLAVRQADDRSEGTAQRREDRPIGGATSQLIHRAISEGPRGRAGSPLKHGATMRQLVG